MPRGKAMRLGALVARLRRAVGASTCYARPVGKMKDMAFAGRCVRYLSMEVMPIG